MSQRRKRILAALGVVALAIALIAALAWDRRGASARPRPAIAPAATVVPPRPPTRFEQLPRVLARVGATEITKDDLKPILDSNDTAPAPGTADGDEFYDHALWLAAESEVVNRVLLAEAQRRGITLGADERSALQLPPEQRAQLDTVAPQFGMSAAELLARREDAKLVEKLVVAEIYDKVEVSEDEIVAVYETETGAFFQPDGYRVRRVVLQPRGGEDDAAVLARAQELHGKLAAGGDFAAAARRATDAPAERASGGLLPDFTMANPPTRDAAFLTAVMSLEVGRVARPIKLGDGYQVLFLERKLPPRRLTLDEARPEIVKHLQWSKGGPRAMAWVEELKRKAGAVILVPMPDEIARSREAIQSGAP